MAYRTFSGIGNATNTASTTVPLGSITGAATFRARIYEFVIGSDTSPADNAGKVSLRRTSGNGTTSATFTPTALDPAEPASLAVFTTAWSGNPTITANSDLYQVAVNQRATYRFIAAPDGEFVIPATSGAGIALMAAVTTSTYNLVYSFTWRE
jgi:hypothetical protein